MASVDMRPLEERIAALKDRSHETKQHELPKAIADAKKKRKQRGTRKPYELRTDALRAARRPNQAAYLCRCGAWHLNSGVRGNLKGEA